MTQWNIDVGHLCAGVRVVQGDVVFVCRCSCRSRWRCVCVQVFVSFKVMLCLCAGVCVIQGDTVFVCRCSCHSRWCLCAGVRVIQGDIVFVCRCSCHSRWHVCAGVRVIQGDIVFVCRCSCHSRWHCRQTRRMRRRCQTTQTMIVPSVAPATSPGWGTRKGRRGTGDSCAPSAVSSQTRSTGDAWRHGRLLPQLSWSHGWSILNTGRPYCYSWNVPYTLYRCAAIHLYFVLRVIHLYFVLLVLVPHPPISSIWRTFSEMRVIIHPAGDNGYWQQLVPTDLLQLHLPKVII